MIRLHKFHVVIQSDNFNTWEVTLFHYIKMPIFRNNEFCTSTNSTIYKFVVIWVSMYQLKLIIWSELSIYGLF